MLNRKQFILAGGAALAGGCRLFRRGNPLLEAEMERQVSQGRYGCLVCCSNRGDAVAVGSRTVYGEKLPVNLDSRFDLASVGKTQTAALCALLYAKGELDVDAPFTRYLDGHVLAKEDCRITVRDLATHTGGFDNSKPYMVEDRGEYFRKLMAKRPVCGRGASYCYACSNFVYLGLIVEKLTGFDLDTAARRMLWGPLGMNRTTWLTCTDDPNVVECPESTYAGSGPHRRIGERNDYCAYLAGRPMGNGASFSTGPDMLRFVTDMLERRTFPKAYYDLQFGESALVCGHRRSFGWDMLGEKSTFSDWTKTGFSRSAICHTGWTGPAIAVDPEAGFAGVVLGNQLSGKTSTMGPRMHLLDMMREKTY